MPVNLVLNLKFFINLHKLKRAGKFIPKNSQLEILYKFAQTKLRR